MCIRDRQLGQRRERLLGCPDHARLWPVVESDASDVEPLQDPGDVETVRDREAAENGLGHDLVELPRRRDRSAADAAVPQRVPEAKTELSAPVQVVAARKRLVRIAEG